MKKHFWISAVCAAAISLWPAPPMNAQGGDGPAARRAGGGPLHSIRLTRAIGKSGEVQPKD